MFGLPFSWDRPDEGRISIKYPDPTGVLDHFALPTEALLIERVEVLAEAADRARLLLKLLPGRIDACKTPQETAETVTRDLIEAEDALWCALHPE